jgi:hypothetical protein
VPEVSAVVEIVIAAKDVAHEEHGEQEQQA